MELIDLIERLGDLPIVNTELLFTGNAKPNSIKVQIARWHKAGKLIQLRRGIYLLAEPYRKVKIYEPFIASVLNKPSYISLEKALEFHGLIPEAVPVYTSVTTKRPGKFETKIGVFDYRHIHVNLFWGYESVAHHNQTAFIASPEKALLDFIYLKAPKVTMEYLTELRLQNMDKFSTHQLTEYAARFGKKKVMNAAKMIAQYIRYQKSEGKKL